MTRIVFAGTPEAAVPSLRTIHQAGHEIVLVLTRPDAPLGRKRTMTPSPVALEADRLHLPVRKTNRFDDETVAALTDARPDVGVVVAYGALIPDHALTVPTRGWLNLHFSVLPKWRGAAPVQRALQAGDQPGISVIQLVSELDAGPVWTQRIVPLPDDLNAGEVLTTLSEYGTHDLNEALRMSGAGDSPQEQVGTVSYATKLSRDDGRIHWDEDHVTVLNQVRAMTPEPGAWSQNGDQVIKVHRVSSTGSAAKDSAPGKTFVVDGKVLTATATEFVELLTVQPAGKSAMPASDWMRGIQSEVNLW